MKIIAYFIVTSIVWYLLHDSDEPIIDKRNDECEFFCEPDSTFFVDGIQSNTFKSKHFVNEIHLK